tara:strand:+ start:537 stop:710 length:174 start_codon:yes stop_codon:yes gene_type:complete
MDKPTELHVTFKQVCHNCNQPIMAEPIENAFCSYDCLGEKDDWADEQENKLKQEGEI